MPSLAGTDRHMAFYLANGLKEGLDPTRFFSTDWYAWQNPDWCEAFSAPYLHFMEVGRKQGRDPSPMVDVTRYLDMTGGGLAPDQVYPAILAGMRSVALGVYEDEADLLRCQNAFMDGIAVFAHRAGLVRNPRKALVVCQAGRGALLDRWALDPQREWDLLLNYYDSAGMKRGLGDYVFFQKGTKFTAMKFLTDRFPQIFSSYDHVLFVDDDIGMSAVTLNALFAACRTHSLDLAQMSLTAGSACNWSELFARPGRSGPRDVSAVEIMMPVFPVALSAGSNLRLANPSADLALIWSGARSLPERVDGLRFWTTLLPTMSAPSTSPEAHITGTSGATALTRRQSFGCL